MPATLSAKYYLTVLVLDQHLIAYQKTNDQQWQVMPIKGEEKFQHLKHENCLKIALEDITEHFNLKHALAEVKVSILYQQGTDFLLGDVVSLLRGYQCKYWQILSLDSLYRYATALQDNSFNHDNDKDTGTDTTIHEATLDLLWVQNVLLPLVWHEDSLGQQQQALNALLEEKKQLEQQLTLMQNNAEQALAQQVQQLEKDKSELQQQISQAKDHLQRLQQPDMESLVCFLPAIFKDFWNIVRPDELAMQVGVINPPQIPSPYNAPSLSAVQQKKRQFVALAPNSQDKIIQLCRELAHNYHHLVVHAEFKPLIGELD